VRWGLEYTWAEIGAVFPAVQTIYASVHDPADADVVANKHYYTEFAHIHPTADQDNISSILVCRLFRDADNIADNYEADAGVLFVDFHFEVNMLGSRTPSAK
jgi:hypothetical protein